MRILKFFPIVLLAALIAVPSSAQAQNGNRVLIGEFDYSDPWIDFAYGINQGEGEMASFTGYYYVWGKVKESSSGNIKEQAYLSGFEWLVGQETGDMWLGIMEKSPIHWHYGKDGISWQLQEACLMTYYKLDEYGNLTDERVKLVQRWHIKVDKDGNMVKYDTEIRNVHYFPPK